MQPQHEEQTSMYRIEARVKATDKHCAGGWVTICSVPGNDDLDAISKEAAQNAINRKFPHREEIEIKAVKWSMGQAAAGEPYPDHLIDHSGQP